MKTGMNPATVWSMTTLVYAVIVNMVLCFYRHVMYIVATDEAGKTGRAQLTVDVNKNLFPPVIQPPLNRRINISDNLSPGITITTVKATDNDTTSPANTIEYYIRNPSSSNVHQLFRVTPGGELRLIQSIADRDEDR